MFPARYLRAVVVAGACFLFESSLTVTDGNNLKLNGNFSATADDTLTLARVGSNWYEVGRSVN